MTQIPAGWYADPTHAPGAPQPQLRWWDGAVWTEHVAPGGPAPVAAFKTTPDGERLAGWWPRLGAVVIDSLITTPVALVLSLPFLISYFRANVAYMDEVMRQAQNGTPPGFMSGLTVGLGDLVASALIGLVVTVAYHGSFLRLKGATPGKMVLGLHVRLREAPGQLPWSAIVKRLFVQHVATLSAPLPAASTVAALFPLLDGLWPLWDDKNQALHDKLARTNVVVRQRQA